MINELRLGNFLYQIDRSRKIHLPIEIPYMVLTIGFKVEAIPYNKVPSAQVEKWNEFHSSDLSPIPLTEEWLLRFGFELEEGWYWKSSLRLFNIRGLYFRANFPIKADILYVHSLQNLYFALTGEELEIKDLDPQNVYKIS